MSEGTTAFICGGESDHEQNEDHVFIETFGGEMYSGTHDEMRQYEPEARMSSLCCSICGSSNFGRDVYYGLE